MIKPNISTLSNLTNKVSRGDSNLSGQGQAPKGVKVISVLDWIGGIGAILFGIFVFVLSLLPWGGQGKIEIPEGVNFNISLETLRILGLVLGVILVILGIVLIFVAINIKRGKNWARITQIILSSLSILFGILGLFTGNFRGLITSATIPALIVYYLLFNQEAKQFFTR